MLITGEHGTGKDLVARMLHASSARSGRALISVNMGGLTESLFESELFGHVRGAFTDAKAAKRGKLELAGGGAIFFDEIGNIGIGAQAKLLRAIQEKEITRVGDTRAL